MERGDAEIRESVRASIRRLAAVAEDANIADEPLELLEMRDQQLKIHFRRFYDEHLKIVAEVDENDGAREANEILMANTEEMYLLAHARYVRQIRHKTFARDEERARQIVVEREAAYANAQDQGPLVRIEAGRDANEPPPRQAAVGGEPAVPDAAAGEQLNAPNALQADHFDILPREPDVDGQLIGGLPIDGPPIGPMPMAHDANPLAEASLGGSNPPNNQQADAGLHRHVPPDAAQLQYLNRVRAEENAIRVIVQNDHHIQLPMFDGDFAKWTEFRDSFLQLVHEREDKSEMAKFNLLSQHLTSNAARVIAGLARRTENYAIAWQLLCEQYEHPRMILHTLFQQLKDLRPISEGNAEGLQYIVLKFKQILRQLHAMGYDQQAANPMLIYQLASLIDATSMFEWESRNPAREVRPIHEMLDFLQHRANCFIHAQAASGSRSTSHRHTAQPPRGRVVGHMVAEEEQAAALAPNQPRARSTVQRACPICKGSCTHAARCPKLTEARPFKRTGLVRKAALCLGCLEPDHTVNECNAPVCPHCPSGRQHHELLCFTRYSQLHPAETVAEPMVGLVRADVPEPLTVAQVAQAAPQRSGRRQYFPCPETNEPFVSIDQGEIELREDPRAKIVMANQTSGALLATAIIRVRATNGEFQVIRALCDTGAQTNLITERCVQLLAAIRETSSVSLNPVGTDEAMRARGAVQVVLAPLVDGPRLFRAQVKALVLKKITNRLPAAPIDIGTWPPRVAKNLADPTAAEPGPIDMLLGAHVWGLIAQHGLWPSHENDLVAQDTQLGWLIFGGVAEPGRTIFGHMRIEQEETADARPNRKSTRRYRSKEEQQCEEVYVDQCRRLASGRYCVPIPLKAEVVGLGKSHSVAARQFFHIEPDTQTITRST